MNIIISNREMPLNFLKKLKPRYLFFPFWSWRIPREIFKDFECVIFHMTDLPFGRGGHPYENLRARGITDTKITALKAVWEWDTGPIYLKRDFKISDTKEETIRRASKIIFEDMIPYIIKNQPEPVPQTGKITKFKRF